MDRSRIPNKLRKYRRQAGLSQQKVAAILGLYDSRCISRWEKGVSVPELVNLFKLSLLYSTVPHVLYDELYNTLGKDIQPSDLVAHDELISSTDNDDYDLNNFF